MGCLQPGGRVEHNVIGSSMHTVAAVPIHIMPLLLCALYACMTLIKVIALVLAILCIAPCVCTRATWNYGIYVD